MLARWRRASRLQKAAIAAAAAAGAAAAVYMASRLLDSMEPGTEPADADVRTFSCMFFIARRRRNPILFYMLTRRRATAAQATGCGAAARGRGGGAQVRAPMQNRPRLVLGQNCVWRWHHRSDACGGPPATAGCRSTSTPSSASPTQPLCPACCPVRTAAAADTSCRSCDDAAADRMRQPPARLSEATHPPHPPHPPQRCVRACLRFLTSPR